MDFTEHGIFEVKVENEILLVDATGPFNKELLIKYEQALASCIEHLEASPWNQIITLHQFSVFTPEAESKLTQTLINRKARGLIACAVVLSGVECEPLIKAQMSRCYQQAGIKYQFTASIIEAKDWLITVKMPQSSLSYS